MSWTMSLVMDSTSHVCTHTHRRVYVRTLIRTSTQSSLLQIGWFRKEDFERILNRCRTGSVRSPGFLLRRNVVEKCLVSCPTQYTVQRDKEGNFGPENDWTTPPPSSVSTSVYNVKKRDSDFLNYSDHYEP